MHKLARATRGCTLIFFLICWLETILHLDFKKIPKKHRNGPKIQSYFAMTPQKIYIPPKIFIFLKLSKNIEIQNFEPKKWYQPKHIISELLHSPTPHPTPHPGLVHSLITYSKYRTSQRLRQNQTPCPTS